jgi:cell division transport system permease protein
VLHARVDLPVAQAAPGRLLAWLAGGLVYAAVMLLAILIMADQAIRALGEQARLVTVTLPVSDDIGKALTVLHQDPAVLAAAPVHDDELRALIAPWLGETRADELPLPAMIDVSLDPLAKPDLAVLRDALREVVPGATLVSDAALPADVEQIASLVRAWSGGLLVVVLAAGVLAFGAITGLGVRLCRDAVELLRGMGASPGYLATQFERHALGAGLRGAAGGVGLALLTLGALLYSGRRVAAVEAIGLGLRPLDWALLAGMAATSLLLLVAVVRMTALWQLQRRS